MRGVLYSTRVMDTQTDTCRRPLLRLLTLTLFVMGCATNVPPETPELAFASPNGPVIVAHRGGALEVPENPLAAVRVGSRNSTPVAGIEGALR